MCVGSMCVMRMCMVYSFLQLGKCCVYVHTSLRTRLNVTTQTCQTGSVIAEQHCGSCKTMFWPVNWLLPLSPCHRHAHTYAHRQRQKNKTTADTEYSQASKLIGERNSITGYFWKQLIIVSDVGLGGYVSKVCAAVVCNSDQEE